MKNKLTLAAIISGVMAVIISSIFTVTVVSANVSYFIPGVSTAAATSTVATVNPFLAPTTLTFNSLALGSTYATDRASLLVINTASTSASVLKIAIQYSQNGVDWYDNNLAATTSAVGAVTDITTANTYQLAGNTVASTSYKIIGITTPTQYVRAVFTGVATSTLWAQFVPIRQVQN